MKNCRNLSGSLSALLMVLMLTACDGNSIDINTTFSSTRDIQQGTPVYFENQVVGRVKDVETIVNGIKVELSLDKQLAQSIRGNAAVVVNRFKQDAPLEIYNRATAGDEKLVDGQAVVGLDSMFQLGAWMVEDAIQLGSGTVSQYVETFQDYLQSEKFQQDKEVAREQIDSARNVAQEVFKNLESELAKATEDLAASEQAAAQAVEQLGNELAPMVEDMAGGSARLMEQLEQFTEGLEQIEPGQRLAGQQFLASLLATLEQLNQSMEQGGRNNSETDKDK